MDTLSINTLRRNAFRTLGLTGAATQEQIESAARMMRLYDGGDVPPTPRDAHWLGPVPRSLNDIESALTRLTDPDARAQERLWWYCTSPPGTDSPRPLRAGASAEDRICHQHDETLTALMGILIAGNEAVALMRWHGLLDQCQEVARADEYLQWMLAVENQGAFEKPATLEELARWQGEFAHRASTALVALADERLDDNDFRGAGRVLGVLRQFLPDRPGQTSPTLEHILNRFEDTLIGQCNQQVALVDDAWTTKRVDRLKPACIRALNACELNLTPLADELDRQLHDPDRAQRVRGQLVTVYVHIADAYEACMDNYASRQALMKSLPMAAGTLFEPRIRQRIDSLIGMKPAKETREPARESANTGGGFHINFSGLNFRGWIFILFIISMLLRVCSSISRNASTSNYSPQIPMQDGRPIFSDSHTPLPPGR